MPSHIHAYAYLSRAAHDEAIDEVSLQVQLTRIETFVKSYNIPNRKVFRQTPRIGHMEEALTQAAFESAIAAAKRTGGFIVVSSLDRVERNSRPYIDFVSGGGTIVAVDEGFGVHESDVRDLAAKAAVVRKHIADQARLGRESALERGVTFGNPRVRDAGVKGTQANQVNARERYIEFLELMDRAKANGARLDKQIVAIFNTWGYPNARGRLIPLTQVTPYPPSPRPSGLAVATDAQLHGRRPILNHGVSSPSAAAQSPSDNRCIEDCKNEEPNCISISRCSDTSKLPF